MTPNSSPTVLDIPTIERYSEIKYTQPNSPNCQAATQALEMLLKNKDYLGLTLEILQTSNNSYALMVAASCSSKLFTKFNLDISPESAFAYSEAVLTLLVTKSYPQYVTNMLISIPARIAKLFIQRDKERCSNIIKLLRNQLDESMVSLKTELSKSQYENLTPIILKISMFSKLIAELVKEMSTQITEIKASKNKKITSYFKENELFSIFLICNKLLSLISKITQIPSIPFPVVSELLKDSLLILKNIINYDYICTFISETVDSSNLSLHIPLFFQPLVLSPEELEKSEGFDILNDIGIILNFLFLNEKQETQGNSVYRHIKILTDCLCRLSQIRRVIFPNENTRNSYLSKNMLLTLLLVYHILKSDNPNNESNDLNDNLEKQDMVLKVFELFYSIKSNYPMSELLNIPFFWVYLDKSIEFSFYCTNKIPFNDEKFQFLLKNWSKVSNAVHYLYSASTSSLLNVTTSLNNMFLPSSNTLDASLVNKNIANPTFLFKEYGLSPIKYISLNNEEHTAREIVTNCLMSISKNIIEAMVKSVDYSSEIGDIDYTFPFKGNVNISKCLPIIIKTHGAQLMLENLTLICNQLNDEYINSLNNSQSCARIELKLAKIVEVICTLSNSNSYYIDGHDGESINKEGFALIAVILLKLIVLIENRLQKDKDTQTLKYLDIYIVKLIKCFSINFFDSNSPLNYYSKLALDTSFFEKISNQLGPFLTPVLESETPIKINSNNSIENLPKDSVFSVSTLEGIFIRKVLTNLKLYNQSGSDNLITLSISAFDSILTSDMDTDKLDFLKCKPGDILKGKLKYVNLLLLVNIHEFSFLNSDDKSLLKIAKRLYELIALLMFSKYGIKLFSIIINYVQILLDKLNNVVNTGSELTNEIRRMVFIITYSLRGIITSFNTYDNYALFIRWFTEKNNSILLRTLETYSNDGNITSAVIKLYCDLSSVDNVPVGNTLILSTTGGMLPSDKLILIIFKDITKIVLILSHKLNAINQSNETKKDSDLSTAKYKPLCLAVKLLMSTVSCEFISFGAMSFYSDNSLYKCLSSIISVILSSPFIDIISHQKLFFYIIKLVYKLIKKHIEIVIEFGDGLITPMLALILEAIQMPSKKLRMYATRALTNLLEFRYKEWVNPVWKKEKGAEIINQSLNSNSENLINIFEAMFDNFVIGNAENYPEFIEALFLIVANYGNLVEQYKIKILNNKENAGIANELGFVFNKFIEMLNFEFVDNDCLDEFKITLDSFTSAIGKLSVKISE